MRKKTIKLRRKFIEGLVIELARNNPKEVHVEEIMSFAEDISRYLENEDDEECEMNQQHAGVKELFRGYMVIDWEGANFKNEKYKKLNRAIVKRCTEHHDKCWKHRNNEYHDEEKQRKRLIKWHEKVKRKAENSDDRQLRAYGEKRETNVNRCKNETIKRWICNTKEFDKRMKKTKKMI